MALILAISTFSFAIVPVSFARMRVIIRASSSSSQSSSKLITAKQRKAARLSKMSKNAVSSASTASSSKSSTSSAANQSAIISGLIDHLLPIQQSMSDAIPSADPAKIKVLTLNQEGINVILNRLYELKLAAATRPLTAEESHDLGVASAASLQFTHDFVQFFQK
jgi:hypothetical protein